MQLGQPEGVGPLHDQGVGVGDVEPGLDDRGAHQDVVVAVPEALHGEFELLLGHLPVRDDHPRLGHQGPHPRRRVVDAGHPVVHVERLPVTEQFAPQGRGDLFVVLRTDVGQHRVALLGRGEDGRHLTDAGQAHLQRARDRRGAHRQHVDVASQRLDVLLVFDAEPLLLVDHDQAEVLPSHAGLQQPVRADHDVDAAVCHAFQHFSRFARIGEARQQLHGHREARHPGGERLHVLVGQQGGGDEHGHLLAVLHRLERGPHRDLGLAVTHIATDDPVHRDGLLHVGLHLGDGRQLVDGLGEAEGVLHFGLPWCVGRERMPRRGLPLGVESDKLAGDLPDCLARLGLRVGPVAAAQLAQSRLLAADVAGQLVQRVHRDEQLVGPLATLRRGVFQNQVFAAGPADGALRHLHEPADAVLVVHHQIARGQRQRVDGVATFGRQPLALGAGGAVAGQIGLGDHHQFAARYDDARVQRPLQHPDHTGLGSLAGLEHGRGGVVFAELLDHAVGGAGSRGDHRGQPAGEHMGPQHREDLLDAALLAARRWGSPYVEFDRAVGAERAAELADRPPRVAACPGGVAHLAELAEPGTAELFDVDRRLTADGGHRPGCLQELPPGLDQVGRPRAHLLRVAQQDRGSRREMVGQQAEPFGAQHRGQRLHPVDRYSFGELCQHVADTAGDPVVVALLTGDDVAQFGCARTDFIGQQQFATCHGDHRRDVDIGNRALVGDREHPHLGDLITPELHPYRMLGGGREDVENSSSHREFAAARHHVDTRIGKFDQPGDHRVEVEFGTHRQPHRVDLGEVGGHGLQQRSHRRHHDAKLRAQRRVVRVGKPTQQHHPRADGVDPG